MRVDPGNISTLVQRLGVLTQAETKVTQQTSTGSRLTSLGDDPSASAAAIALSSSIAATDTFVQTSATALNRMQAADSALGSVVTALTSAISFAVQGSTSTLNATNLQSIAQQIASVRDTVLSLANSSYQGTYLFAGTQGTSQPFAIDASGEVTYAGDDQSTSVAFRGGATVQTSIPGSQVFGSGEANDVFQALNRLVNDFSSGTASASATDDLVTLRSALGGVTQQRSVLDSSMSRLTALSDTASSQSTNLQAAQTALVAADPAALATQLSAVETQRSALMSTIAAVQKSGSLFDYM